MVKKIFRKLFSPALAEAGALPDLLRNPKGSVLFLRIDRLGDLLVSTPLVRAFKRAHPGWTATLLAGEANAEAAFRMDWIDRVLVHEKSHPLATLARLRRIPFDLAVDLSTAGSFSAGFLVWFSGAPLRVGYVPADPGPFFNLGLPLPPRSEEAPQLDLQEELARFLGLEVVDWSFDFRVGPAAEAFAAEFFKRTFDPDERVIALHPGNIKKQKMRWPIENFIELTERLAALAGVRILLLYGPGELSLSVRIRDGVSAAAACRLVIPPACTLAQSAALIARCRVFLDSGPTGTTHLAVTLPTPQVTIYSGFSFKTWDTRKKGDLALVSSDWEETRPVEVEAVVQAVVAQLLRGDGNSQPSGIINC